MTARTPAADRSAELVCLGIIGAPHGVRGAMKVKTFTATPQDLAAYGPLTDQHGARVFVVKSCAPAKQGARITLDGVMNREAAAALTGTGLYVARAKLPQLAEEDDFYHADLIGLAVKQMEGASEPSEAAEDGGRVVAVHNFGAGDLLEIVAPDGGNHYYPFTKAVVPEIDLAGGTLTLVPPREDEARPPEQLSPQQTNKQTDDQEG